MGLMIVSLEIEYVFQLITQLTDSSVDLVGIVQGIAGRMNFIDREMKVQIVRIVVDDADALMLAEPKSLTNPRLDRTERLITHVFPRSETQDQMVGLIRLRTGVLRLRVEHFEYGDVRPVAVTVCDRETPDPLLAPLRMQEIVDEVSDTTLLH